MTIKEIAATYLEAGLNVLPAMGDTKRPLGRWKKYTEEVASLDAFDDPCDAIALVCGAISGGVEALDFDQGGRAFSDYRDAVIAELGESFFSSLVLEKTQKGGLHLVYRTSKPQGNQKLALDSNKNAIIETRGEGGILIIAPSVNSKTGGRYELLQGDWTIVPKITDEQREKLLEIARRFNAFGRPVVKTSVSRPRLDSVAERLRQDPEIVRDALRRRGWEFLREDGEFEQWKRPGQPVGDRVGGSLSRDGYFHCFTSNAYPLEPEGNYSPMQLLAALDFDGDESACAKFYSRRTRPIIEVHNDEPETKEEKKEAVFPQELYSCGGLIQELRELIDARSRRPQPEGAHLSAMCVMSFLMGRSIELYNDGTTTTPNIYGLFLAPSGMGKEAPRRVASDVARVYNPDEQAPEAFASVQALQNTISRAGKTFWLHDEFGRDLAVMRAERSNPNVTGIITESLKLYSNANNRAYLPKLRAAEALSVKRPQPVDRPYLTIFATGNPRDFYASASETLLHNGYVARFTIVQGRDYSPKVRKTYEDRTAIRELGLDRDLESRIRAWSALEAQCAEPLLYGFDRDADRIFQDYDAFLEMRIKQESEGEGTSEFLARCAEKHLKYALIFAASERGPRQGAIDARAAELGRLMVQYEIDHFDANNEQFGLSFQARLALEIRQWARAVGSFTRSQFTRKFQRKGSKRERDEAIDTLVEANYIREVDFGASYDYVG